ncbi:protein FAR1-RELATED SEQUENCE 4-like isoform X2 [Ananas comosus]|uniref:Protein FAR1-RELATED SEQUENCE 4-like isoform X2 n=1 Tax=Ananas comosus TaxID=4615 RepID=A0A6P5FAA9_ANACO|nr:protein FAR1-RELATED SEQUENCE 4-like isoform X2 [Ananas comosus]
MVLIAEILDDAANDEEGRSSKERGGGGTSEEAKENCDNPKPSSDKPEVVVPTSENETETKEPTAIDDSPNLCHAPSAAETSSSSAPATGPPPEQPLYNEYALRVAYIMRSYLSMRQPNFTDAAAASGGVGPSSAADAATGSSDRCKAMMEVVLKEHGRWAVSKLVAEHNHPLLPPPEGCVSAPAVPVMGMEFESAEAAKAFYYGYGESSGFKARTGSNRRSSGSGALIMQRFLCWRGSYLMYRNNQGTFTGKRKRGPYKKRALKAAQETAASERDGDVTNGAASNGLIEELQSSPTLNDSLAAGEGAGAKAAAASAVGLETASAEVKDDWKGKDDAKAIPAANTSQSRLLRELGVRVSRYTNEERRNIILKYMMKRNNRPGVERPSKVPSRQALARRRQRGSGGRFLSTGEPKVPTRQPLSERRQRGAGRYLSRAKAQVPADKALDERHQQGSDGSFLGGRESQIPLDHALAEGRQQGRVGKILGEGESQTSSKVGEVTESEADAAAEISTDTGGEPKVGMVFLNEDKAYEFYVRYATTVGFNIRKGWWDKTARNVTRSRVYVCSREGFRPKNITTDTKKPRPETRTGCQARMAIRITSSGKYSVSEFIADHNHELAPSLDIQMLRSQKISGRVQRANRRNASLIPADYKNYLRSKRTKNMQLGDAGAVCEYLQKMKGENPAFFYAIQVDEDDQLTNIFWSDAKSRMDYCYFGDVVCFDSSYRINDYGRPFALFIGVNHHKQTIVFGTALLYDETVESFKWLFETFKNAMGGKQPKTILSDQSTAIAEAIGAVWPGSAHRLCVWHIYQNATKHLNHIFESSESFAHDFSKLLYDFEEEEEFVLAWESLAEKYDLKNNEWFCQLNEEREKWALVYGRETFCADIESILQRENMQILLKEYLKPEIDIPSFVKQLDKLVEEKRYAELLADYHANQGISRIPPLRLLWQAATAYTPSIFEQFRMEFELFLGCMVYCCGEVGSVSEYQVTIKEKPRGHFVRYDSSDFTIFCSCKKFESIGVPCCHMLKVLDFRNIKELPPHYILKRWRKDAKNGSPRENDVFALDDDAKSSLSKRYGSLLRILYRIAYRAAETMDTYAFMESQSDQLLEQVENILQTRLNAVSKGQQQTLVQNEGNINEFSRKASRKKNKNGEDRCRHQNPLESNKRQKGRQGVYDEANGVRGDEPSAALPDIPAHPRNPPNQFLSSSQFMQTPYVPSHQFGLGPVQGIHEMTQFSQESSSAALPPQPFHSSSQLTQNAVQGCPAPDVHSLQFVASNPQLGEQSTDQRHCTIPLWDFL